MYSFKKTLWKAARNFLVNVLPIVLIMLGSMGLTDLSIAELLRKIAPVLGTVTLGSVIQALINWLKNKD